MWRVKKSWRKKHFTDAYGVNLRNEILTKSYQTYLALAVARKSVFRENIHQEKIFREILVLGFHRDVISKLSPMTAEKLMDKPFFNHR